MTDPFLKLLREMGLSPKELFEFKQKQTQYKQVENNVLNLNNKTLGSKTGTKSYTWKRLYEHIENKKPDGSDIYTWTKEEMNEVLSQQTEEEKNLEEYGLTSEIISTIIDGKNAYEIYANESKSNDEVIKHIIDELNRGQTIDVIINVIEEWLELFYKYYDSDNNSFPHIVEQSNFDTIYAVGIVLGFE